MNGTLVYLPFSTRVIVQGFTDSSAKQRAIFTAKGKPLFTLTGTGIDNAPMGSPQILQTPTPELGQTGFAVEVLIEHGEPWLPSRMVQGRQYKAAGWNLVPIVSEDWIDNDWNDCVVQFIWTTPTPSEEAAEEESAAASSDRP